MGWVFGLLCLTVLIVLHELGHLLAAKALGIHVERFGLFFGPKLAMVRLGQTEYRIGVIPLGGYVKISGMTASELTEIDLRLVDRAYCRQPPWRRIAVIAAGPAMNVLVAFAILWGLHTFAAVDPSPYRQRIAAVAPQRPHAVQPAAAAGLPRPDLSALLAAAGDPHRSALPLGAIADSPGRAVGLSLEEILTNLDRTISLLPELPVSDKARASIHGPVGVSVLTNEEFNVSTAAALRLIALLSLSLAVLNLLPFLPLDGGRIVWVLAEQIHRRPISEKAMNRASYGGATLVVVLMLMGLQNDIHTLSIGGFKANAQSLRTYPPCVVEQDGYCADGYSGELPRGYGQRAQSNRALQARRPSTGEPTESVSARLSSRRLWLVRERADVESELRLARRSTSERWSLQRRPLLRMLTGQIATLSSDIQLLDRALAARPLRLGDVQRLTLITGIDPAELSSQQRP